MFKRNCVNCLILMDESQELNLRPFMSGSMELHLNPFDSEAPESAPLTYCP